MKIILFWAKLDFLPIINVVNLSWVDGMNDLTNAECVCDFSPIRVDRNRLVRLDYIISIVLWNAFDVSRNEGNKMSVNMWSVVLMYGSSSRLYLFVACWRSFSRWWHGWGKIWKSSTCINSLHPCGDKLTAILYYQTSWRSSWIKAKHVSAKVEWIPPRIFLSSFISNLNFTNYFNSRCSTDCREHVRIHMLELIICHGGANCCFLERVPTCFSPQQSESAIIRHVEQHITQFKNKSNEMGRKQRKTKNTTWKSSKINFVVASSEMIHGEA